MTIQEMIDRARVAVDTIKDYDQAQVDKLVYEAAKTIYKTPYGLQKRQLKKQVLALWKTKSQKIQILLQLSGTILKIKNQLAL